LQALQALRKRTGNSWGQIATDIRTTEKNLRRYLNSKASPPPTLGGDVLYRLCQLEDVKIPQGGVLKFVLGDEQGSVNAAQQMVFDFTTQVTLTLPARRLMASAVSIVPRKKTAP
jgi:hypothetical protein